MLVYYPNFFKNATKLRAGSFPNLPFLQEFSENCFTRSFPAPNIKIGTGLLI